MKRNEVLHWQLKRYVDIIFVVTFPRAPGWIGESGAAAASALGCGGSPSCTMCIICASPFRSIVLPLAPSGPSQSVSIINSRAHYMGKIVWGKHYPTTGSQRGTTSSPVSTIHKYFVESRVTSRLWLSSVQQSGGVRYRALKMNEGYLDHQFRSTGATR